jgi:hypothetical protein
MANPIGVFHLDCGSTYVGASTSVITGLGYLEGETVTYIADGVTIGTAVVTGGQITISVPASYVVVGFPFITLIKTLPPDAGAENGTALGRKMRVSNPTLYFYNTGIGVQFGPDEVRLKDIPDLVAGALSTIKVPVTMPGGYDTNGQIVVKMEDPLPMTLSCISYDVEPGE